MRIQHNIMAMGAYRHYTNNNSALAKNLEKLSSGYKINRAGDDAAGLAISEKMRAQITGLEVAQKNSKDGISLIQTAEGALTEVHDMLNRMYSLAEQSANGTYDNEVDRIQLQKEIDSLRTEVDRIADSSNFNGIKLLNGDLKTTSSSALGGTSATVLNSMDGSAPTKAGAAEITVSMKDGTAAAAQVLKSSSTDGNDVILGTKAELTIKVGGQQAVTGSSYQPATVSMTVGGQVYNIASTNTTVANQAKAWAAAYTADRAANNGGDYTAEADDDGKITIKATATGTATDAATMSGACGVTFAAADGTFTDGNATASATFKFSAAPTLVSTAPTTAAAGATLDLQNWAEGDKLTLTVGGKTVTYTAKAGDAVADLKTALTADGFAVADAANDGSTCIITAAQTTITNANKLLNAANTNDATITAGTTKISDLLAMRIDSGSSKTAADLRTIGNMYDIEITCADGTTKKTAADKDYVITNGDTIKLTAKFGGKLSGSNIADALTGATISSKALTGANAVKGSTEIKDGTNEGQAAVEKEISRYTMTFDTKNLNVGQTIQIDNKVFEFTKGGTVASGHIAIDLSNVVDADSDGVDAKDYGTLIQTAITGTGGLEATNWTVNADKTKPDGNTFTLVLETESTKTGAEDTNWGEGRVTVGTTEDGAKPINVTYDRAGFVPADAPTTSSPFATATYTYTADLAVGDRLYIGDAEIEIVDNGTTAPLTATQIKLSDATGANAAANLAKIIEQQKPNIPGKVTFDTTNKTITITGKTVGQSGTDLKKAIGDVKFMDHSENIGNASTATNTFNEGLKIVAGTTTVDDLLTAELKGVTGSNNTIGDIFEISVNGNAKGNDYKIQEGDEVKFIAKPNGKVDDKVMENFNYSGDITSLVSANGYDEGSNATGNKTRYDLTIDMAKVAGGNSFTFGNVNGKSVTFELSYDKEGTGNNTVGANDKTDIANNSSTRVQINLFGKSTADAQEEIFKQVQTEMAKAGFNVNRATSGNKITLALEAKEEGIQNNLGNIRYSSLSDAFSDVKYTPAGGSAGGVEGTHAQVSYKFDTDMLQVGDKLTVGDATVYIGEKTTTETVDGATKFTVALSDIKADPNGVLVQTLESAGFKAGQIRFDTTNKTMTITDAQKVGGKASDLQKNIGKVTLGSTTRTSMETGGLRLQIGDTADSFNQLQVSINDCHAAAMKFTDEDGKTMSIADIDIRTQDGAAAAMKVIKNAINYVSDVRGTLGATQNRLDHTINNLSVMRENIQDAESTIRDTDIAEEMMAYTKNNILVQSAQAMLAQANQLPQGVLQLLQ